MLTHQDLLYQKVGNILAEGEQLTQLKFKDMILTTEEVLINLTNALAAEQDKNKILAEQKAELLEALESIIEDPETASWIIETGKAAIKQAN